MASKTKKLSSQVANDVQETLQEEAKAQGKTAQEVLNDANAALNGSEAKTEAPDSEQAIYRISVINGLANSNLATDHIIQSWELIKREIHHFLTNEKLLEYYNSKEEKAQDYDPKIVAGEFVSELDAKLQMWAAKIAVSMTLIEMEANPTPKFIASIFANIYKQFATIEPILKMFEFAFGELYNQLDFTTVISLFPFATKSMNENRRLSCHPGQLSTKPYRLIQISPNLANGLIIRARFGFAMPEDVMVAYSINDKEMVRIFVQDLQD